MYSHPNSSEIIWMQSGTFLQHVYRDDDLNIAERKRNWRCNISRGLALQNCDALLSSFLVTQPKRTSIAPTECACCDHDRHQIIEDRCPSHVDELRTDNVRLSEWRSHDIAISIIIIIIIAIAIGLATPTASGRPLCHISPINQVPCLLRPYEFLPYELPSYLVPITESVGVLEEKGDQFRI